MKGCKDAGLKVDEDQTRNMFDCLVCATFAGQRITDPSSPQIMFRSKGRPQLLKREKELLSQNGMIKRNCRKLQTCRPYGPLHPFCFCPQEFQSTSFCLATPERSKTPKKIHTFGQLREFVPGIPLDGRRCLRERRSVGIRHFQVLANKGNSRHFRVPSNKGSDLTIE